MKIEDLCLPSAIDSSVDLPPDEGFELTKNVQFYSQALVDTTDTALTGARSEVHSLSGYEEHAELLGKPEFPVYQLGRWTSDVEFGRQILNGVNPVVICMCKSLPGKFPVTTEMVQSSLHRLTLEKEMEVRNGVISSLTLSLPHTISSPSSPAQ